MNSYEVIFILDPVLTEDGVEAEIGAVREVVAKKGGEVAEVQKWGKKRLAYEVKKNADIPKVRSATFSAWPPPKIRMKMITKPAMPKNLALESARTGTLQNSVTVR